MTAKINFLRQLSDWIHKIVVLIAIVLLVVMLGLSLTAILSQIIRGEPVTWSYSLTRLFLPWVALLSIAVTLKTGEHIGIRLFVRYLPPQYAKIVKTANLGVIGLFALALIWYGIGFFLNSTQMFMVSDTLQLSHKWTAAVVPLTGVIIAIHVLGDPSLVETDDPVDQLEADKGPI